MKTFSVHRELGFGTTGRFEIRNFPERLFHRLVKKDLRSEWERQNGYKPDKKEMILRALFLFTDGTAI